MKDTVSLKKNKPAGLAALLICAVSFVLVFYEVRSGDLKVFDLTAPPVIGLLLTTIICGIAGGLSEDGRGWIRESWYICLYILLRIASGLQNGVAGDPAFRVSLCWEAFFLLAAGRAAAGKWTVKAVLCMVSAFDLIAVSICMHRYLMSGHLMWSLSRGELPDIRSRSIFTMVFNNPNSAGLMAGLTAAVFLLAAIQNKGRIRALSIIVAAVNIPVLYWAECRTAIVGLAVFAAVIAADKLTDKISPKLMICAVLALCIGVAAPAALMGVLSAEGTGGAGSAIEQKVDDISSSRYDIWKQHIISMKGHWLLGFGTLRNAIDARVKSAEEGAGIEAAAESGDSSGSGGAAEADPEASASNDYYLHGALDSSLGPHNGYLELLLVAGLPGFLLIMLFLCSRLRALNDRYIRANPVMYLLVYLFCVCASESRFITAGGNYPALLMMLLLNMRGTDDGLPAITAEESYELAPGALESECTAVYGDGRSVKLHILSIAAGSGTDIKASCGGYYAKGEGRESRKLRYGYSAPPLTKLSEQAGAYMEAEETGGELIAASSGDFFGLDSGRPEGTLVMEGRRIYESAGKPVFEVRSDGSRSIRASGVSSEDAAEAIGGSRLLVSKGKIRVRKKDACHPRQAIGLRPDGTLVILNAESRQPDSQGLSKYDAAVLMKELGCTDALNLDGGGSAGFMTKRRGDSRPVFRNIPADGFERSISSALLIVKDAEAKSGCGRTSGCVSNRPMAAASLVSCRTFLDKTISGRYRCLIDGRGYDGLYNMDGEAFLFKKGRGVTTAVMIGENEYSFRKGRYTGCSDPDAGRVLFGYCGLREQGGRNLVYALHTGDWVLNIGLNDSCRSGDDTGLLRGQMEDWGAKQEARLPWYAYRHRIRRVYIGDGVTTIGSRFLYEAKGMVKGGTETPFNELESLRLPGSLTRIGERAFYNKPRLKEVELPSAAIEIGKDAFDEEVSLVMAK